MTLVNFYNQTPSAIQVAADLKNGELTVFTHMTSGAGDLLDHVQQLVAFDINMHHENAILKWEGEDYFVMIPTSFDYPSIREKLRATAAAWFETKCPNQVKRV